MLSPFVNVEGIAHTTDRAQKFDVFQNTKERERLEEINRQISLVKSQILELKGLYHETATNASGSVLIFPSQWVKELGFIHDINTSADAVTKDLLMIHRTLPLDESFISNVWRWTITNKYKDYVTELVTNELAQVYSDNYQEAVNGFVEVFNHYKPKNTPGIDLGNLPENWREISLPQHWEIIKRDFIPGDAWDTDRTLEDVEDDVNFLHEMRTKIKKISGEDIPNKTGHPVGVIMKAVQSAQGGKVSEYIRAFFEEIVRYSNFPLTSLITDAVYDRYVMYVTNKVMTRDDLFLVEGQTPPAGVNVIDRGMTQFTRPVYWEEAARKMKMFYSVFVHDGSRDILEKVMFRDESPRLNAQASDNMGRPVDMLYHNEMTWISEHAPDGRTELKNQLILLFHMWVIGKNGTLVRSLDDLADDISERAKRLSLFFIKKCYIPESLVQEWFTSDVYLESFFFDAKIRPYLNQLSANGEFGLNANMTMKEMISVFYRRVFLTILTTMVGIVDKGEESGSYIFLTEVAAKRGIFEDRMRVNVEGLYTVDNVPAENDESRNKFISLPDQRWVRDKLLDYMITIVRGKFLEPFFKETESATTFLEKIKSYESYFKRWRNYYEQFYELFRQNREEIEKRLNQRLPMRDDPIRIGVAISKAYADLYGLENTKDMIVRNKKYVPVNVRINRPPIDYPSTFQYTVESDLEILRERPINTEAGVFDIAAKKPLELSGGRRLEMRVDISLKPLYYVQLPKENEGYEFKRMEVKWVQMRNEVREKGRLIYPKAERVIKKTTEVEVPITVRIGVDLYGAEDYTGVYKVDVKSYFLNKGTGEVEEFENRSNWVATIDERLFCLRCRNYFNRYRNPFGACKWNERMTLEYVEAMETYRAMKGRETEIKMTHFEKRLDEAKGRMPYETQKLWIDKHSEVNEFHEKADREKGIHGSYISEEWGYNFEEMDRLLTEAYEEYEAKIALKRNLELRMTDREEIDKLNKEFKEWEMKHSKFRQYQKMYNQMQKAPKNPLGALISPKDILGRYNSLALALRGVKA